MNNTDLQSSSNIHDFKFEKGQRFGVYISSYSFAPGPLQFLEILETEHIPKTGYLKCLLVKWFDADGTPFYDDQESTLNYRDIVKIDDKTIHIHKVINGILVKNQYEELALKLKYESSK